jgi:hypothetical protein
VALPQDLPLGDARGHEANDKPQSLTPSSETEMSPRLPTIFDNLDIPERTAD